VAIDTSVMSGELGVKVSTCCVRGSWFRTKLRRIFTSVFHIFLLCFSFICLNVLFHRVLSDYFQRIPGIQENDQAVRSRFRNCRENRVRDFASFVQLQILDVTVSHVELKV
jgi:hypothetical protein